MVMTEEWSWTLDKSLPSDIDLGHGIIELLIQALETAQWNFREQFHIRMAVEEAVVNAIEHGNKRIPIRKSISTFESRTTSATCRLPMKVMDFVEKT